MNPPPRTDPLRLAVAAEPTAAFHVRARLRAWLDVHRWPGEAGGDVILVVNELVTNAAGTQVVTNSPPIPTPAGSSYGANTARGVR